MAKAPTRYYVEWMDGDGFAAAEDEDPHPFLHSENFNDLDAALAFREVKAQANYAAIFERSNIYDTTPKELRRWGITWYSADFDEELIED